MPPISSPVFEHETSLFSLATEYLEAADILTRAPVLRLNVSLVTYYLLGHAGELLLKSYLFKRQVPLDDLKFKLGHNLSKLIRRAQSLGLPATVPLPHLEALSKTYTPKSTEYRQFKAASFPPKELLLSELRALERQVFHHIAELPGGA